jgi:integrase
MVAGMARPHKPWYRKSRKQWCVEIDGKQYNLGPDQEEAKRRYHSMMAQKPAQASRGSVAKLLDDFIIFCEDNRATSTARWYRDFLQDFLNHLKAQGYAPLTMPASDLRPLHVRAWTNTRKTAKRARITAAKAAYRWGHEEGYIEANPIAAMKRPAETKRNQLISIAEMKAILRQTRYDKNFRHLLIAAWDTGARPQELKILHDRHLDLANHRAIIPAAEAKGKERDRVIYFTARVERIIRRRSGRGLIFTNGKRPWTSSAVKDRFVDIEEQIGTRYCLYAFRHSFATRKLNDKVPAIYVANLLGHGDVSTLAKVYQHVEQDPAHMLNALNAK